jgi:hypothetical protein
MKKIKKQETFEMPGHGFEHLFQAEMKKNSFSAILLNDPWLGEFLHSLTLVENQLILMCNTKGSLVALNNAKRDVINKAAFLVEQLRKSETQQLLTELATKPSVKSLN